MEATQDKPQEMQAPEATQQHRWLQKLVGKWTVEGEANMGPDQPPSKYEATEVVRAVGDVWVLAESGIGSATNLTMFGYDIKKQRFVGTFVTTMLTNIWVYEGELEGERLTLSVEGPAFTGDGTAQYRDVYEFLSHDHRTLTSYVQEADGSWHKFMTAHYRRAE